MDAENIRLELLSVHHLLDQFQSGDAETDRLAAALMQRVRDRDLDGDFVVVVAADAVSHEVAGIVATTDIVLVSPDPDDTEVEGKCLFYYLLAVSRDPAARGVLQLLLDELDAIRSRRFNRDDYIGEVAAPLRGIAAEENSLMRYVENRGFRRLGEGDILWFRPRQLAT